MREKFSYEYDIKVNNDRDDWFEEQPTIKAKTVKLKKKVKKARPLSPVALWKISILTACIILGVVISLLFKTYGPQGGYDLYGRKDLAKMVKYLEKERKKLETSLTKARETITRYEETSAKGKGENSEIRKQLLILRQEAGMTRLKGPGIVVQLNDSPLKSKAGDDPNLYIVHDVDLQALINELWATGAEAVSINDQRIVMNTAIRCVGPTITVNTVRLTPPYIVKAIGPPQNLETGLRYTGGFMDTMSPNIDRGVSIKISQKKYIEVPSFKGSIGHSYAQTMKEKNK